MSRRRLGGGGWWPRSPFEYDPVFDKASPSCPRCGGLRKIPEPIDEEKLDALVPCPHCQMWCLDCKRYVTRKGHVCRK